MKRKNVIEKIGRSKSVWHSRSTRIFYTLKREGEREREGVSQGVRDERESERGRGRGGREREKERKEMCALMTI